jgi:hypothetical protein
VDGKEIIADQFIIKKDKSVIGLADEKLKVRYENIKEDFIDSNINKFTISPKGKTNVKRNGRMEWQELTEPEFAVEKIRKIIEAKNKKAIRRELRNFYAKSKSNSDETMSYMTCGGEIIAENFKGSILSSAASLFGKVENFTRLVTAGKELSPNSPEETINPLQIKPCLLPEQPLAVGKRSGGRPGGVFFKKGTFTITANKSSIEAKIPGMFSVPGSIVAAEEQLTFMDNVVLDCEHGQLFCEKFMPVDNGEGSMVVLSANGVRPTFIADNGYEITADEINYNEKEGLIIAKGNVVLDCKYGKLANGVLSYSLSNKEYRAVSMSNIDRPIFTATDRNMIISADEFTIGKKLFKAYADGNVFIDSEHNKFIGSGLSYGDDLVMASGFANKMQTLITEDGKEISAKNIFIYKDKKITADYDITYKDKKNNETAKGERLVINRNREITLDDKPVGQLDYLSSSLISSSSSKEENDKNLLSKEENDKNLLDSLLDINSNNIFVHASNQSVTDKYDATNRGGY